MEGGKLILAQPHMSSVISKGAEEALSPAQKEALLKLLTDEDRAVYHTIRSKLISYGPAVLGWLRPHALSSDPVLRRRAQEIVHFLRRQESDNRFLAFCLSQGEDLDLEEGVWLLAQTQYPDANKEAYSALLDNFASELRERLEGKNNGDDLIGAINDYLFEDLGFIGNEKNYYEPDNSYINRVIDRRTGNPISLCLLYLLLGRRLQLPVAGIGMPGHFLARYQSSTEEIYIDAFNQGKLLTKADCIKYLVQTSHGFQEGYLSPVSSRRILLRICSNLHQIYIQLELADETARLQRYIVALAK
jgi:regulator of sirC expression with transglutaminase-like and TPR domain